MKKFLSVLLLLVLILALAGCSGDVTQPEPDDEQTAEEIEGITIGMGSAYAEGVILNDIAIKFKEVVEEKSDGKIMVEVYGAGSLGNDEDIMQSVTAGAIEGQAVGGVVLSNYAPQFDWIDAPFVIKDWDHIISIWNSELGESLRGTVEAAGGTTLAAPVFRGHRHFTSNRPVNGPEDLQGMKLRLPVLPTWIAVFEEIGANVVPVPLGELYTALATGVAEASEGDVAQIHGFKLNEVQSHLSLTGHSVGIGFITFNTEWLNSLNEKTRDVVLEAAQEAADWGTEEMVVREDQVIQELESLGMEVVHSDKAAIAEAGMPAMEELFETQFKTVTLEEVQSYAN